MRSKTYRGSYRNLYRGCIVPFFVVFCMACGNSDNNSNPSGSDSYSIGGFIQKGPLAQGSEILVQQVDVSLTPVGDVIVTETIDDFGEFVAEADITGDYFDVEATGLYYNEVTGLESDSSITLYAIVDAYENSFNINILTTLAYERTRHLILNNDMSLTEAQDQAEDEVMAVFHVNRSLMDEQLGIDGNLIGPLIDFYQMDLSKPCFSCSFLLAVSSILQWGNTEAELSDLIAGISTDIETDGTLDDQVIIDELRNNTKEIVTTTNWYATDEDEPEGIRGILHHVYTYYQSKGIELGDIPLFTELLVTEPFSPVFNLLAGTYTEDIFVSLSSNTVGGADIYYTTDGSEPTNDSAVYSGPIPIEGDGTAMIIKAFAAANGLDDSRVVSSYYKIDSGYNPSIYMEGLTIGEFASNIVGTWVGHVETPWTDPYNVELVFTNTGSYSGSYSAHTISQVFHEGLSEYWEPAFYYGSDEDNESKTYEIKDVNDDGRALGDIVIFFFHGSTNTDKMDEITFYNNFEDLSFELWHHLTYGPVTFTLTRK